MKSKVSIELRDSSPLSKLRSTLESQSYIKDTLQHNPYYKYLQLTDYGVQSIGGHIYLVVKDYQLKQIFNEIEKENETKKNNLEDLLEQQKTKRQQLFKLNRKHQQELHELSEENKRLAEKLKKLKNQNVDLEVKISDQEESHQKQVNELKDHCKDIIKSIQKQRERTEKYFKQNILRQKQKTETYFKQQLEKYQTSEQSLKEDIKILTKKQQQTLHLNQKLEGQLRWNRRLYQQKDRQSLYILFSLQNQVNGFLSLHQSREEMERSSNSKMELESDNINPPLQESSISHHSRSNSSRSFEIILNQISSVIEKSISSISSRFLHEQNYHDIQGLRSENQLFKKELDSLKKENDRLKHQINCLEKELKSFSEKRLSD